MAAITHRFIGPDFYLFLYTFKCFKKLVMCSGGKQKVRFAMPRVGEKCDCVDVRTAVQTNKLYSVTFGKVVDSVSCGRETAT